MTPNCSAPLWCFTTPLSLFFSPCHRFLDEDRDWFTCKCLIFVIRFTRSDDLILRKCAHNTIHHSFEYLFYFVVRQFISSQNSNRCNGNFYLLNFWMQIFWSFTIFIFLFFSFLCHDFVCDLCLRCIELN